MAVEVEAAGQVDEFIRILRRRIWWIIVPVAVIGSLGVFFAVVVPKKYVVSTKVLVGDSDEQSGDQGRSNSATEGAVAKINLTSTDRIHALLLRTNWGKPEDYRSMLPDDQGEYRDDLLKDLRVSTPAMARDADQQLVGITFEHTNKTRAKEFLNLLRQDWIEDVLLRHLAMANTDLRETDEKLKDLVKEREVVMDDLRSTRTEFKIPPPSQADFLGLESRMTSFAEQDRLVSLVTDLEYEIGELRWDIERDEDKWARMDPWQEPASVAPASSVDKKISDIDEQISALEEEIAVHDWLPNHSGYRQVQVRIEALKDKRVKVRQEEQRDQFETGDLVPNQERKALRSTIDEQNVVLAQLLRKQRETELRLGELDGQNEELQAALVKTKVKGREEDVLSEEIRALSMKKTSLELKVRGLQGEEGNPFKIVERPREPSKPTSPNAWAIAIGSIVFGLALGFGLALLKEYSKSCFRSARELNRVMTHPVLGTVNAIRTRRERARDFLVRSVLGGGSLLFVLSVGYVTWAWANDKDSLTDPLVDAIEAFQDALK